MNQPANPVAPHISSNLETPARWEERSVHRIQEPGRAQFLERSRRIVDAAYDLLAESGLEGLTIRAVLNKTGLSRRAFYERFEGKDDLVLAVFEQTIQHAASQFGNLVKEHSDPVERLHRIVTLIVLGKSGWPMVGEGPETEASSRRGAALSREHLRLAESRPRDLQVALRPLIDLLADQLAAGMAAGQVREGDPERLAALLYNLVSTTVHTELLAQEGIRSDRERRMKLAEDVWEFCRRAISA